MKKETLKKIGFGLQNERAEVYSYPRPGGSRGLILVLKDDWPMPADLTVSVPCYGWKPGDVDGPSDRSPENRFQDMQRFVRAPTQSPVSGK